MLHYEVLSYEFARVSVTLCSQYKCNRAGLRHKETTKGKKRGRGAAELLAIGRCRLQITDLRCVLKVIGRLDLWRKHPPPLTLRPTVGL